MKLFRASLFIGLGICIGIIVSPMMSGDIEAVRSAIQVVGIPAAVCAGLLYLTRERHE